LLGLFTAASPAIGLARSPAMRSSPAPCRGARPPWPSTLALLTTAFPPGPERTRAIGYYGGTAGVGASLGLVIGGVLTDLISWRVGFFLNVPIGIAMMFAVLRVLPGAGPAPTHWNGLLAPLIPDTAGELDGAGDPDISSSLDDEPGAVRADVTRLARR
jgi:MFS family permease